MAAYRATVAELKDIAEGNDAIDTENQNSINALLILKARLTK